MKPYVNFPEFEADPVLKKAWKWFNPFNNRNRNKSWKDCEKTAIVKFNLKGKRLALFLGHSSRWAGHDLIN